MVLRIISLFKSHESCNDEHPGDIKQLLNKNIPIKINEEEVTAYVDHIQPFFEWVIEYYYP